MPRRRAGTLSLDAGEIGTAFHLCLPLDLPTPGSSGHPLIRSLEPGEEWSWCYIDEVGMLIGDIHGHTRIPPSPMLAG